VYHSIVVLLRRAFVVTAVAWAIALPVAAWIASRPHASGVLSAMTIAIYGIGSIVCHQLPGRSFRLWTAQLPVCARCTGIYFGAAIAAIILGRGGACAARGHGSSKGEPSEFGPSASGPSKLEPCSDVRGDFRVTIVAAAVPSLATLIYEWTTGDVPSNWIRAAAGLPLGIVVAWLVQAPPKVSKVN
jgi:hypothetical protein